MGKPLKIGLDVVPLRYPYSGVRAYVEALIDAFRDRDAGIELIPLPSPASLTSALSRLARIRWDFTGVAGAAGNAGVDLLHMTRFAAPGNVDRPMVVTIHDLIPFQLPEYRASPAARFQSDLARTAIPRATRVIVPSEYVADVVTDILQIDHERIDVIPMGVGISIDRRGPSPFSGPYILHTGGFDVRKNVPALVRAFARVSRQLGPDWRLVLVGAPHSGNTLIYPPIDPLIAELGLQNRVVRTGQIGEREKQALYRHASMAVSPSLSEGFGLPILEAMAYGIPVIASNCTSHPEVAGDAAFLVEPTVDALAEAIQRLARDEPLRTELATKGRVRAGQFPWTRTARATRETYRRALES